MTTCFLPNGGEFGWFLMGHVKRFQAFNDDKKVIICKENEDVFFPSADEIIFENYHVPDADRMGSRHIFKDDRRRIQQKMRELYGQDVVLVPPFGRHASMDVMHFSNTKMKFRPNRVGVKVDVVITPRQRDIIPERNFNGWDKIIKALKEEGLTVGAIGLKDTTLDLDLDVKSWEHIPNHTDIELLQNCKLCIALNSGCGLLSLITDTPTLMIHPEGVRSNPKQLKMMIDNHDNKFTYDESVWDDPDTIVKMAKCMIT